MPSVTNGGPGVCGPEPSVLMMTCPAGRLCSAALAERQLRRRGNMMPFKHDGRGILAWKKRAVQTARVEQLLVEKGSMATVFLIREKRKDRSTSL